MNPEHAMLGMVRYDTKTKKWIGLIVDPKGKTVHFETDEFDTREEAQAQMAEYIELVKQGLGDDHEVVTVDLTGKDNPYHDHVHPMATLDPDNMSDEPHVLGCCAADDSKPDEEHNNVAYCDYCERAVWATQKVIQAKALRDDTKIACPSCMALHWPDLFQEIHRQMRSGQL